MEPCQAPWTTTLKPLSPSSKSPSHHPQCSNPSYLRYHASPTRYRTMNKTLLGNEQDFTWFGTVYQVHPFPPNDNEQQRIDCLTSIRNIDHHFQTKCTVFNFTAPILPPQPQHCSQLYNLPVFEGVFPTFNAHTIEPTGYNLYLRSALDTFTLDPTLLNHYPGLPTELLPPPVANQAPLSPPNQNNNHTQRLQRLVARITRSKPTLPTPRQAATPIVCQKSNAAC